MRLRNSYAVTIAVPHIMVLNVRGTTPRMSADGPPSLMSSCTVLAIVALPPGADGASGEDNFPTCSLVFTTSICGVPFGAGTRAGGQSRHADGGRGRRRDAGARTGFVRVALVMPARHAASVWTGSSTGDPCSRTPLGSRE